MDRETIPVGPYQVRQKCCAKCACRRGSPERQDPYGWIWITEMWPEGEMFFCHEGIPWHHQFEESAPLFALCGGWNALRNNPRALMMHLGTAADDLVDGLFGSSALTQGE